VGLILLVYWIRVLQMVRRARKTAGHDANFIPPERLGRILRYIWIPTVVVWIFMPLIGSMIDRCIWLTCPFYLTPIAGWIAVFIAIVAFTLTVICWHNMGKSWRMGINPGEKTELVFSGPFAYVRNPIYGLSQLLMLCAIVTMPNVIMLIAGVIHILFMQWEVRREERNLISVHGEPYRAYLANVGRFIPKSLRPYHTTQQRS
jgi:protein-S-isoprenylcysteine O-methyltransferase Ste14